VSRVRVSSRARLGSASERTTNGVTMRTEAGGWGTRSGIFRSLPAKLRGPSARRCRAGERSSRIAASRTPWALVPLLRSYGPSVNVFRGAVLSIVLLLAVGQDAVLLCRIWCDTHTTLTTAGCQHQGSIFPLSVRAADNCNTVAVAPMTFVREDVRRGTSAPSAQDAVFVSWMRFVPPAAGAGPRLEQGRQSPLEARPLTIALRL
jgi:hypothetical protein